MHSTLRTLLLAALLALPLASAERAPLRPVNLNTATATELMQLPRVGAGGSIVALRTGHGGFRRVEELMNVKGIGEKSFHRLRPHLTLGPAPKPSAR